MKMDVADDGTIRLKEVYNSVVFETKEGNQLTVCMRDGGFEIKASHILDGILSVDTWYSVQNGEIKKLGQQ